MRGPAWRVACFAWLLAGGCAANTASLRDTRPCPSDLALDVSERLVDARRHPPWDLKQYQKLRWPAEHGDPMSPAFFVDAQAAIARVLELEAQQPKLIPAGFRADVRARPRDPWLRLRMARCELHAQHARRRASYDAALALLFGAPQNEVEPLLLESTRDGRGKKGARCGAGQECPQGQFCSAGECASPQALAVSFVAPPEIEIEDQLTRAIMRGYYSRHGEAVVKTDWLYWWAATRLHRCGEEVCTFAERESQNEVRLVEWDLRDGGTRKALSELPPEERRLHQLRQRCFDGTGVSTTAECLELCEQRHAGDVDCRAHCYQSCE
ncbi:MAG TPA: hypothetical protein VFF06_26120 [Polyangia bacterium]|nr:hypothetical protein [Polyangia bacterium]